MKILVAEPLASEGLEILRAPPRGRREGRPLAGGARRDHRRLRRARRPQPGQGRRRDDRRRHPPRRHRPGRRRRGQRGPRGRHPGRDHRRQRPHRQHDLGRRADDRPDARRWPAGPPPPTPRCAAASGSAAQFTGVELRGRTLGHRRPRQDRPGRRGPRPRTRDEGHRHRTRSSPPSRPPSTASSSSTFDELLARAGRHHRPRAAEHGRPGPHRRRGRIDKMKPGVMLVNVARGGVVDEAGRGRGARDGQDRAAPAIDVFENEPPAGSPLLDAPNTVLTPHLGASTAEAQVARGRGGVRAGHRRPGRALGPVRGQRAAAHAGDGRAIAPYLPLAETLGRIARAVSRGGVQDADRGGRRRARRPRRVAARPPPRSAASSRRPPRSA